MLKALRKSLNYLLIFLVASVLSIAVAEIAARAFYAEAPFLADLNAGAQLSGYMEYDPTLGWRPKPNADAEIRTLEYRTRIRINAKGFRGPEVPYAKAEGERRILVLGDSFAEGYTVDLNWRFSNILAGLLNESAKNKVSIVNLGVAGYSNDQELLMFEMEGKKYDPDLVVLLVYHNDIVSNIETRYWRGNKPVFELSGTSLVLGNTPVPRPAPRVKSASADRADRPQGLKYWLLYNSRLCQLARQAIKQNRFLLRKFAQSGLFDERSLAGVPDEFLVYSRSYDEEISHAWKLTEAIVRKLDAETKAIGARLIVAYVPIRAAVYPEDWDATRRTYGMSSAEWDVHRVASELGAACRRLGVPYLDLTADLAAAAAEAHRRGERVYFRSDVHWTPEGNAVVARALAKFLDGRL